MYLTKYLDCDWLKPIRINFLKMASFFNSLNEHAQFLKTIGSSWRVPLSILKYFRCSLGLDMLADVIGWNRAAFLIHGVLVISYSQSTCFMTNNIKIQIESSYNRVITYFRYCFYRYYFITYFRYYLFRTACNHSCCMSGYRYRKWWNRNFC